MGLSFFIVCLFVFFYTKIPLHSSHCPGTCRVDQVGLELVEIGDLCLLSAGIKRMYTTMPDEDSEFYSVSLH